MQWDEQWQEQARQVGAAHIMLKSGAVGLDTAANLSHAEHVIEELERQMQGMQALCPQDEPRTNEPEAKQPPLLLTNEGSRVPAA